MNVNIEHVQLDFIKGISHNVCGLQVASNIMCFALKTGQLFLIDLETPSKVFNYSIPMLNAPVNPETIANIWINPDGSCLFVKTNFAKYYLCYVRKIIEKREALPNTSSLVLLKKLSKKNCDVRTVSWCNNASFLCGTMDGNVYFVDFNIDQIRKHTDATITATFKSKKQIDGILWNAEDGSCVISSSDKLLYWKGELVNPVKTLRSNQQPLESENFEHLHNDSGNKFTTYKDKFAWITDSGVVFGTTTVESGKKVLRDAKVLLNVELSESKSIIRDVALTDFYIILLRGSTVIVVNQITNEVIFEEGIWSEENEKMMGFSADYSQNPPTYWCFSNSNIYEIILQNESKSVWKSLCEQQQYDEALNLHGLDDGERDMICFYKAGFLFDHEDFLDAAKYFGMSSYSTFGSVALKFMKDSDNVDALQVYLLTKLKSLTSEYEVQQILLASWVVWTFLKKLNILDEKIDSERSIERIADWDTIKQDIKKVLKEFLAQHCNVLDKKLVYQLLSSQNRKDELLYFADVIMDYSYILSYWINQENWYESLKLLLRINDVEQVYKFSSILLIKSPESTISTWMQIGPIDPVKLIPSMLNYYTNYRKSMQFNDDGTQNENFALTYLRWCIMEHDIRNAIVYNTAIYMMITCYNSVKRNESYQEEIIQLLDTYDGRYDTNFILRLSLKFQTIKVSCYLYSRLKLYEDAVNLALDNNMADVAKSIINNIDLETNFKLSKSLWLNIAYFTLHNDRNNNDIRKSINQIIKDSNNALEIKDLLPLFDEFITIANLKDELIRSLEKHGQSMTQISEDIKSSIKMKQDIIQDIAVFKERYQVLKPGALCDSCKRVLQTGKFFVFPCNHCFHIDCLSDSILNSNNFIFKNRIENLQRKIIKTKTPDLSDELDDLLSTKCPLCSDININKIDDNINMDEEGMVKWNV